MFQLPKIYFWFLNQKYLDAIGRNGGHRIPRRRPYRLQTRNRNTGRRSNLGFKKGNRKQPENVGYINHKVGFVEDFGDVGLVASESIRKYAPTTKKTITKKVNTDQ